MNVEITYHEVTEAGKTGFAEYLEQKLHRLEKMMVRHQPASAKLHARVTYFRRHNAFDVSLQLSLPEEKDCYSQEVSHHLTKALDVAMDRLESQLTKLLDKRKKG